MLTTQQKWNRSESACEELRLRDELWGPEHPPRPTQPPGTPDAARPLRGLTFAMLEDWAYWNEEADPEAIAEEEREVARRAARPPAVIAAERAARQARRPPPGMTRVIGVGPDGEPAAEFGPTPPHSAAWYRGEGILWEAWPGAAKRPWGRGGPPR